MKNKILLFSTGFLLAAEICDAQVTFQKIYGGTGIKQDYAYDMHKTSDGGYILGGVTENYPTGVRRSYLIKTDVNGDTLWTSIFGDTCTNGSGPYPPQQYINDLAQASDGGYITAGGMALCGPATSEGGEITRLDSSGNVLWSKTCSTGNEDPYPVIQCSDGNFIFGGVVSRIGAGGRDGCLTKIDVNGDTLWSRTYGSPGNEWFYHILQTPDGGYLAAGETDYFGLGVVDTNNNIYLVKTDSSGNVQWSKAYGTAAGNQTAFGHCLQPTDDGGYIVAGAASSQITESDSGIFLMKIDASGNMKWSKYFSGCFGHAVKQTADMGYVIAGTGNYGTPGNKVVLIKTDSSGVLQWARTYGGANTDNGWLLEIASDGGYVTGGWSTSFGNDAEHIYFIKTDANGISPCNETDSAGVVESVAPFVSSDAATQVMTGPATSTFTPLFERSGTIIILCSDTAIGGQISGPVALCANDLAGVAYSTPAGSGDTYSWAITGGIIDSGAGTNSVVVTWDSAGPYQLKVTTCAGAICDSDSISLTVNPVLVTTVNHTICQGLVFDGYSTGGTFVDTFSASSGCDSIRTLYLTVNPVTDDTIYQSICEGDTFSGHNTTGVYTNSLISVSGCDSVVTLNLIVNPLPAEPTITRHADTLEASLASHYQWFRDSILLAGDTLWFIIVSQNGNYSVDASDSEGCSNSSAVVPVINVSIKDINYIGDILVFPNPTTDILNVQWNSLTAQAGITLKLNDAIGRALIEKTISATSVSFTTHLSMQSLAPGVYFLNIYSGKEMASFKVVKTNK